MLWQGTLTEEAIEKLHRTGVNDAVCSLIMDYIERAIPTDDSFVDAVLCNNLLQSFQQADEQSTVALKALVGWLYWEAPSECWGSQEKVKAWLKEHRT